MTMNFQPDAVQAMIVEAVNRVDPSAGIVGVAPISCGAFIYDGFDFDFCQSLPGCAPAVASGIKRVRPEALVFTYQDSVDLSDAGLSELIHAADRGENISIVYSNDNYRSSGEGEESKIKICELLSTITPPAYIARVVVNENDKSAAVKAIANAFKLQAEKKGFSFVEILSVPASDDSKEIQTILEVLSTKTFVDKFGIEEAQH